MNNTEPEASQTKLQTQGTSSDLYKQEISSSRRFVRETVREVRSHQDHRSLNNDHTCHIKR